MIHLNEILNIKCSFCREIVLDKYASQIINKHSNSPTQTSYGVIAVETVWTKGTRKEDGARHTIDHNNGIGFPLKYCPVCGKKINLRNIKEMVEH